jgi:hypothetical protein
MAAGGTSTEASLAVLPSLLQDMARNAEENGWPIIVVSDHTINDSCEAWAWKSAKRIAVVTESQTRYVLSNHPDFAMLVVESWFGECDHPAEATHNVSEGYTRVLAHYGVAHLRYTKIAKDFDLAWGAGCWPANISTPPCLVHPASHAFPALAGYVLLQSTFVLSRRLVRLPPMPPAPPSVAIPEPISEPALLDQFPVCAVPARAYSARLGGEQTGVRFVRGDWALYEDRPGKPGWISMVPNATMEFDIAFGSTPSLAISYLLGYEASFGAVDIRVKDVHANRLQDPRTPSLLDAQYWEKHHAFFYARRTDGLRVTTTAVRILRISQSRVQNAVDSKWAAGRTNGLIGFGVPPFSTATLVATSRCDGDDSACKFKITDVVSC